MPFSGTYSRRPFSRRAAQSVDEALDRIGLGCFHFRLFLLLGLVHMADICDAFLTPALRSEIACLWKLRQFQKEQLMLASSIGVGFGCPLAGLLADRFGRRNVLIATSFSATIFGAITAGTFHFPWLLVLRFLTTLTVGGVKCLALVYMLEFLPKENRGKLLVSYLFFWTVGSFFSVLLLYLVLDVSWRIVIGLVAVPSALATLLATFLPRSPHYLFLHGQPMEADDVLTFVGLTNGCAKTDVIVPLDPPQPQEPPPWRQLLRPANFAVFCRRFRTFFGLVLLWLIINFSTGYSRDVNIYLPLTPSECMSKRSLAYLLRLRYFSASDLASEKLYDDSCCSEVRIQFSRMTTDALHYALGGFLVLLVIDQMGRRIAMVFCGAFACLLFLPLNFCTPALVREAFLCLAMACSAASQGALAVYSAELWPTSSRAFLLGLGWSVGGITRATVIPLLEKLVTFSTDQPAYVLNTVLLGVAALLPFMLPFETANWSLAPTCRHLIERIDNAPTDPVTYDTFPREEKPRQRARGRAEETTRLR